MDELTPLIVELLALEAEIFDQDRLTATQFRRHLDRGEVLFTNLCCLVMDFSNPFIARIESIGVHPSGQRMGLGSMLLEIAEMWSKLRGFQHLTLEVKEHSTAFNFYYKHDYEMDGIRKDWYEDGSDGIVMRKVL